VFVVVVVLMVLEKVDGADILPFQSAGLDAYTLIVLLLFGTLVPGELSIVLVGVEKSDAESFLRRYFIEELFIKPKGSSSIIIFGFAPNVLVEISTYWNSLVNLISDFGVVELTVCSNDNFGSFLLPLLNLTVRLGLTDDDNLGVLSNSPMVKSSMVSRAESFFAFRLGVANGSRCFGVD